METFVEHLDLLSRLWLLETYYSFDPIQYNQIFEDELAKLSASSPEHQEALERMRRFNWVGYIAKSVRNAGYRDQREVQERTHEVVVKLLTGGLFSNYDERKHGPLDKRFKRATANFCKNMVEKDRNRRRFIPTVSIGQEFRPGGTTDVPARAAAGSQDDERLIADFRQLVQSGLGEIGTAILSARLAGQETKSLVGRPDLGSPGRWVIKKVVQDLKALAREYAERIGNPTFLRDVQRAMGREEATITKRLRTTTARQSG